MEEVSVSISICGKNYTLITDNPTQLTACGKKLEEQVVSLCNSNDYISKLDAALIAEMGALGDSMTAEIMCQKLENEVKSLREKAAAGEKSAEELAKTIQQLDELKKTVEELRKQVKHCEELESKGAPAKRQRVYSPNQTIHRIYPFPCGTCRSRTRT